jgi:DNA-binding transcriptional LysR family regulator
MDLLAAFRTFVRVAETSSFSAVAREMHATQPAVSRQIAALEEHFGVRLIHRTTRRLNLTEDGRDLLNHARSVLDMVETTEAALGRQRISPTGRVHVGMPVGLGLYMTSRLPSLLERYPGLSVEFILRDFVAQDMIEEGLDLAVRPGEITDVGLVVRNAGTAPRMLVAAPDYIAKWGDPAEPKELADHQCIVYVTGPTALVWHFTSPGEDQAVQIDGWFRANNGEAVHTALLAGLGIGILPYFQVAEDLRTGRLRRVMHAWAPTRPPVHIVYPSRRNLAPRTRVVLDFLLQEITASERAADAEMGVLDGLSRQENAG